MLVVQAAAGLGKTSLLPPRRSARETGMRVLSARGSELESSFPFGVVRQLFEAVLHEASGEERARLLTGAAELAKPMFDTSRPRGRGRRRRHVPPAARALLAAVNLAHEQPLLISVDDAHWADDPSLKFLDFLSAGGWRICRCWCSSGRAPTTRRSAAAADARRRPGREEPRPGPAERPRGRRLGARRARRRSRRRVLPRVPRGHRRQPAADERADPRGGLRAAGADRGGGRAGRGARPAGRLDRRAAAPRAPAAGGARARAGGRGARRQREPHPGRRPRGARRRRPRAEPHRRCCAPRCSPTTTA